MGVYRVCLITLLTIWVLQMSGQPDPRRLVFKQSFRVGFFKGIKTYRTKLVVDFRKGEMRWRDSKMPRHFQWSKMKVHNLNAKLEEHELDTLIDVLPFPRRPYRLNAGRLLSQKDYKRKLTFGFRKIVTRCAGSYSLANEEFRQIDEFIRTANRLYDRCEKREQASSTSKPWKGERKALKIADKTYWMKGR